MQGKKAYVCVDETEGTSRGFGAVFGLVPK